MFFSAGMYFSGMCTSCPSFSMFTSPSHTYSAGMPSFMCGDERDILLKIVFIILFPF